jgi:hypothetical protein
MVTLKEGRDLPGLVFCYAAAMQTWKGLPLILLFACSAVWAQTKSPVHTKSQPKSVPLTQEQIADKLAESADKLAGRELFLCRNSPYHPHDLNDKPLEESFNLDGGLVTIQSASVSVRAHPPQMIDGSSYARPSGCGGDAVCYEVEIIGSMGRIRKEDVLMRFLLEAKDASETTPKYMMGALMTFYLAHDHDIELKPGETEDDVTCFLGYPTEVNDYGTGGLQWIYEHPNGAQTIVYLAARTHVLANVQVLHQR